MAGRERTRSAKRGEQKWPRYFVILSGEVHFHCMLLRLAQCNNKLFVYSLALTPPECCRASATIASNFSLPPKVL